MQLRELISAFETLWPTVAAEEWDRPGLLIGDPDATISKVLLCVDVTDELIGDAVAGGFDLVLSHHPILLRDADSMSQQRAKSKMLAKAKAAAVAVYTAHTNADITETGVSASLAKLLSLHDAMPLVGEGKIGHGRIGELDHAVTLLDFARMLAAKLPPTATGIRVAGQPGLLVQRVALCAGAGDSFIADAYVAGADLYLTSDLRHHPVQEALELGTADRRDFALVEISHWAAESVWLEVARKELEIRFSQVTFEVSDLRTDPWDFLVTQ